MPQLGSQALVEREVHQRKKIEAWFKDRVDNYERLAKANPGAYRLRVRLFGWFGYSYILFVLLILLALIAFIVYAIFALKEGNSAVIRIAIFAGIVVVAIIQSLWIKMPPPIGMLVKREEAPTLWKEVETIAKAVGAPGPSEIRLSMELNASASQRPRLGILGFYENILMLGMPLMMMLSPEEARSVIAHEYGHFGGQHGRFGAWAYRVNQTWAQLGENLMQTGGRGAWLFAWFVNWFSPRFAAMSFVLRRSHEYEADKAAAKVAGFPTAARALMRLSYLQNHLDNAFWQPYYEKVSGMERPPANAFAAMPTALHTSTPSSDIEKCLSAGLKEKTDYDDTHPCLTDRLRSLGQLPSGDLSVVAASLSAIPEKTAAETFLGQKLQPILQRLETAHMRKIEGAWTKEYQRRTERLRKLQELEAITEPTEAQEVNRAVLTYGVHGGERAEPLLRSAIEKYPQQAALKFYLADILLDRDDEQGIALMQEAMQLDRDCQNEARKILAQYYYRHGESSKVDSLREEAIVAHAQANVAKRAAPMIQLGEQLHPHELSPEKLADVKKMLVQVHRLKQAYIVRRMLPGTGEAVYWVFLFPKRKLLENKSFFQQFQRGVAQMPLGLNARIYAPSNPGPWKRKLDKIPGAKVFDTKY